MRDANFVEIAPDEGWYGPLLEGFRKSLSELPWFRGLLIRGSLARGAQDPESDIDLVLPVAEKHFDFCLDYLFRTLPSSLPARLTPWLDSIVRDFGGLGFVYLLQATDKKWGQLDIYLLPESRLPRLQDLEFTRSLWSGGRTGKSAQDDASRVDAVRRQFEQFAASDLEQAVMACYVSLFLLRKRIVRGDRLQTFADTYASALKVRDLVFLAVNGPPALFGWRDVPEATLRSPDPNAVLKAISSFTQDCLESVDGLVGRIAALEKIVELLVPDTWRRHGEALRSLGRYLVKLPPAPHGPR